MRFLAPEKNLERDDHTSSAQWSKVALGQAMRSDHMDPPILHVIPGPCLVFIFRLQRLSTCEFHLASSLALNIFQHPPRTAPTLKKVRVFRGCVELVLARGNEKYVCVEHMHIQIAQ